MRFIKAYTGAVALFFGFISAAYGQTNIWEKPFTQWTKAEAQKILNDSPWARKQEVRLQQAGRATAVAGAPTAGVAQGAILRSDDNTISSSGARIPVDFTFVLRLRSGLPVRQALLRLKQIEAKYDQMDAKKRAAFDAKNKGLLECPACQDNYVLTLTSSSREERGADPVYTAFAAARLDDIKRYIYIANEKGEQRPLVFFAAPKSPGQEATFFFPRLDDQGQPLFTAESKTLAFNITYLEVNTATNFKVDLASLILNGALAF
jgi:hypothetical protein